jgi:hypothetical protein
MVHPAIFNGNHRRARAPTGPAGGSKPLSELVFQGNGRLGVRLVSAGDHLGVVLYQVTQHEGHIADDARLELRQRLNIGVVRADGARDDLAENRRLADMPVVIRSIISIQMILNRYRF